MGLTAAFGVASTGLALSSCSPDRTANEPDAVEADAVPNSTSAQAGERLGAWYGTAPVISVDDVVETIDTDVLICGAGHSGCACAVAMGSMGVGSTIVIEKNGSIGTGREYIGAINTSAQKSSGVECDPMEAVSELARYASYRCDASLIKLWADNSGEALDFFADELSEYGITHVAETDIGDGYHGAYKIGNVHTKLIVPEGENFLPFMQRKAESYGVQFMFETPLMSVIKDEAGKVVGAYASTAEGYVRINASKGVVLACGGYANDADLMAQLNPIDQQVVILDTSNFGSTGDGIKAGIWAGGIKDDVASAMVFDRAIGAPGISGGYPYQGAGFFMNFGSQPFLRTTFSGKRFCNEAAPYDYTLHAAWVADPHHVCYTFWDANYYRNAEAFHTVGCSRIVPSDSDPSTGEGGGEEAMNATLEIYSDLIQSADTWEELAEKIGMDPSQLIATIDRYNELAEKGVDEDFGKPAKDMIALNTPPYYAVVLGGTLLTTMDGLRVNGDLSVIDGETFEPISGLYAIGDNSGGFFSGTYPELYVGIAAGRSLTWAYLVAKELAE